jgi:hypothetical protein
MNLTLVVVTRLEIIKISSIIGELAHARDDSVKVLNTLSKLFLVSEDYLFGETV